MKVTAFALKVGPSDAPYYWDDNEHSTKNWGYGTKNSLCEDGYSNATNNMPSQVHICKVPSILNSSKEDAAC